MDDKSVKPVREKEEAEAEKIKPITRKVKVVIVKPDTLIVVDDKGNGISTPKTTKHKGVKVGDIINL